MSDVGYLITGLGKIIIEIDGPDFNQGSVLVLIL